MFFLRRLIEFTAPAAADATVMIFCRSAARSVVLLPSVFYVVDPRIGQLPNNENTTSLLQILTSDTIPLIACLTLATWLLQERVRRHRLRNFLVAHGIFADVLLVILQIAPAVVISAGINFAVGTRTPMSWRAIFEPPSSLCDVPLPERHKLLALSQYDSRRPCRH